MIFAIFWIIVCIFLLVVELSHPGLFYALSAAMSAGLCALVAVYCVPFIFQVFIFVFVTLLIFLLLQRHIKKTMNRPGVRTNSDRLIGKHALALQAISPTSTGTIKVYGDVWSVTSHDVIACGEMVEIVAYSGNHLVVKKFNR